MQLLKAAAPIALSLTIIFTVTVLLSHFKNIQHDAQHLVFFGRIFITPPSIVML
jgi:hypothetical protein